MAIDHKHGSLYPEQYRKDTADFVLGSGRTIKRCAADLGVNGKTLGGWVADCKRGLGVEGTARLKPAEPKAGPELATARRRMKAELPLEWSDASGYSVLKSMRELGIRGFRPRSAKRTILTLP